RAEQTSFAAMLDDAQAGHDCSLSPHPQGPVNLDFPETLLPERFQSLQASAEIDGVIARGLDGVRALERRRIVDVAQQVQGSVYQTVMLCYSDGTTHDRRPRSFEPAEHGPAPARGRRHRRRRKRDERPAGRLEPVAPELGSEASRRT